MDVESLAGPQCFRILCRRGCVDAIVSRASAHDLRERLVEALCDLLATGLTDEDREAVVARVLLLDADWRASYSR